jgi:hypothetical protein
VIEENAAFQAAQSIENLQDILVNSSKTGFRLAPPTLVISVVVE